MTPEEFEDLTLRIITAAPTQSPIDLRDLVASAAGYLDQQPASEALLFCANLIGSLESSAVMYVLGLVIRQMGQEAKAR